MYALVYPGRFLMMLSLICMTVIAVSTQEKLQNRISKFQEELENIFTDLWGDEKNYLYECKNLDSYVFSIKNIINTYKKMRNDVDAPFNIKTLTSLIPQLPLKRGKMTDGILYTQYKMSKFFVKSASNIKSVMIQRFNYKAKNHTIVLEKIVLNWIANMHYPSLFSRYYGYVKDSKYLYVVMEYFLADMHTFDNVLTSVLKVKQDDRLYFLMSTDADKIQTKKEFKQALKHYYYSTFQQVSDAFKDLHMQFSPTTSRFGHTEKLYFRLKCSLYDKFGDFKIGNFEDVEFKPNPKWFYFDTSLRVHDSLTDYDSLNDEETINHLEFKDNKYEPDAHDINYLNSINIDIFLNSLNVQRNEEDSLSTCLKMIEYEEIKLPRRDTTRTKKEEKKIQVENESIQLKQQQNKSIESTTGTIKLEKRQRMNKNQILVNLNDTTELEESETTLDESMLTSQTEILISNKIDEENTLETFDYVNEIHSIQSNQNQNQNMQSQNLKTQSFDSSRMKKKKKNKNKSIIESTQLDEKSTNDDTTIFSLVSNPNESALKDTEQQLINNDTHSLTFGKGSKVLIHNLASTKCFYLNGKIGYIVNSTKIEDNRWWVKVGSEEKKVKEVNLKIVDESLEEEKVTNDDQTKVNDLQSKIFQLSQTKNTLPKSENKVQKIINDMEIKERNKAIQQGENFLDHWSKYCNKYNVQNRQSFLFQDAENITKNVSQLMSEPKHSFSLSSQNISNVECQKLNQKHDSNLINVKQKKTNTEDKITPEIIKKENKKKQVFGVNARVKIHDLINTKSLHLNQQMGYIIGAQKGKFWPVETDNEPKKIYGVKEENLLVIL